jgi:hypothetical protein
MQHCDARECRRGAESREENQRKDPTLAHTARMSTRKRNGDGRSRSLVAALLRMTTEGLRARHGLHMRTGRSAGATYLYCDCCFARNALLRRGGWGVL